MGGRRRQAGPFAAVASGAPRGAAAAPIPRAPEGQQRPPGHSPPLGPQPPSALPWARQPPRQSSRGNGPANALQQGGGTAAGARASDPGAVARRLAPRKTRLLVPVAQAGALGQLGAVVLLCREGHGGSGGQQGPAGSGGGHGRGGSTRAARSRSGRHGGPAWLPPACPPPSPPFQQPRLGRVWRAAPRAGQTRSPAPHWPPGIPIYLAMAGREEPLRSFSALMACGRGRRGGGVYGARPSGTREGCGLLGCRRLPRRPSKACTHLHHQVPVGGVGGSGLVGLGRHRSAGLLAGGLWGEAEWDEGGCSSGDRWAGGCWGHARALRQLGCSMGGSMTEPGLAGRNRGACPRSTSRRGGAAPRGCPPSPRPPPRAGDAANANRAPGPCCISGPPWPWAPPPVERVCM